MMKSENEKMVMQRITYFFTTHPLTPSAREGVRGWVNSHLVTNLINTQKDKR